MKNTCVFHENEPIRWIYLIKKGGNTISSRYACVLCDKVLIRELA